VDSKKTLLNVLVFLFKDLFEAAKASKYCNHQIMIDEYRWELIDEESVFIESKLAEFKATMKQGYFLW